MNETAKPDCSGAHTSLSWGQRLVLGMIRFYQLALSPWIGRQCRFYPTCSHYAAQAIAGHGVLRGAKLSVIRLAKCQPFHPGGVDLVPAQMSSSETETISTPQSPTI